MINITKEKGYVVITSDDEKTFLIGEGILSVPCNTIEYTLDDESDFIQFNSIYEDGILFVGTIGNIQVNGTLVTRENIIEQLDSVFNESYEGGDSSSSGVEYAAGDGISIEDNTITNTGVTAINFGSTIEDWSQKTGIVTFYTNFYDGSYDVNIGGTSFYGLKPIDDTILLENAGGTANGNFRCGIKVNTDNFKTINGESIIGSGDITISGGESGSSAEETDPIFTAWKDNADVVAGSNASGAGLNNVALGSYANASDVSAAALGASTKATAVQATAVGNGASASAMRGTAIGSMSSASGMWGVALGYNTSAPSTYGIAIGANATATSLNSIAIGYNAVTSAQNSLAIGPSVSAGTTNETWTRTNINNVLKGDADSFAYVKAADGSYVQLHTEWTGTQSEYDALETYYDTITYNIIEG